jgi:hypothetical protein
MSLLPQSHDTFHLMERKVWIAITVIALAVAGFLGYRVSQLSNRAPADAQHTAEMQRELDAARASAQEAARRTERETEARRLADLKAKEEAETEARRLAQSESERQAQEQARQRAEEEARKAAAELDRIRADRARLEAEAARLNELRARDSSDAQAKLTAAQRALEDSQRQKDAEIARQAAVIASYSRAPNAVERPAEAQTEQQHTTRIVFPSNYRRANHYYLPLLPVSEK